MHGLPVLFIVMNNAKWGAVERSLLAMYPGGTAAKSNESYFMELREAPVALRLIFEGYCAVVFVTVLGRYLAS